jgi:hypothetical protein
MRRTPAIKTDYATNIDLEDREHVRHWTRVFHCSERQLREAVARAGSLAARAQACFRRRAMKPPHAMRLRPIAD